ncbi:formate-dependent phosphoribosylglycinamide formyltransferase [Saccharicrinis fermentans]|uniref:Formate-dependent phosphoribosylglycinamide formyltransferase n=1 Tax=Saccharicrinis fermentans DSM 9555 = JCM 21142 TaxID=869213 RepID=W7YAV8_9BACT|nr:formate-dependent phosphoribosylglycinamide formyltransferase [Saccharicrinis fermentans]GAF04738.1 phosphoribosylglycinamide formyltransferase 2 [Saccharicrinis fermentans DSM 9555 = JCM 21142]
MTNTAKVSIGTPLSASATKVIMLGSGELGKEVVIELQRYGVEVIALDKYKNAPAMQVAHRSYEVSMLDGEALARIIRQEKPDYIIPEVEAIATDTLLQLENEGFNVIPTANATKLTMNREGIRSLAAEELGLRTSPYRFAGTKEEFEVAVGEIGFPCVIKPIMSSSGKGQSVVKSPDDIDDAWQYALDGARGNSDRVIIEGFVDFDYEITLLTISHIGGVSFCAPIGHRQEGGDYQESWQPQAMSSKALVDSKRMAEEVVKALGGRGLFGVEFFVKGDEVYFSELSPRPHDTGMVTMISQDLSEFALHVRAILGLPIPNIVQHGPAASSVIMVEGNSAQVSFSGIEQALTDPDTQIRLFGKPEVQGERRMGVCLARGASVEEARAKANKASEAVKVRL